MQYKDKLRTSARFYEKCACMMRLARDISKLSTCKRLQVGCVITTSDFSRIHIGYNGRAAGEDHDDCSVESVGRCGCIHAEANALIKVGDLVDGLLFTTASPCGHCAGLIINSRKVSTVLYDTMFRDISGLEMLIRQNMSVILFDPQ